MIDFVGFLAGILTVMSFIPQVVKTWRTRKSGDLSLGTGILLVVASLMWTAYGVLMHSWPMMITNVVVLFCVAAILLRASLDNG